MAQLGDFVRARTLVRSAARAFGAKEPVSRARCIVAEAEIALSSRDLGWPAKALDAARATLENHGDRVNAAHARYLDIRRLLLIGRLDDAERSLAELDDLSFAPPALKVVHELVVAGIAIRRIRPKRRAPPSLGPRAAARDARIPALTAEVESAARMLNTPAARRMANGDERLLLLEDVEALLASRDFVVDACRHIVRHAGKAIPLASRPVLFALARALGEAWPGDVPRDVLVARAFGGKRADESHRARLRVEIGRLRIDAAADCRRQRDGEWLRARAASRPRSRRPGAAERDRRGARGRPGLPRGRRVVVELGAGAGAGRESAHGTAGARFARVGAQGSVVRARTRAPLDNAARPWIHDNVVTPGGAAG